MDRIWNAGLILLLASSCHGFLVPDLNVGSGSTGKSFGNSGQSDAALTPDNYPYHVKFDDNYELKWNFNSTHIIFHTHVKTNGYIGLGISGNGAMYPSDVIITWVKDGQVHFADRHATGHVMPAMDSQQDWHLISGTEQGGYTTITMIRKLDTCDDDDFPISTGTTRLIYSYSPTDPGSDNNIGYHGNTRGTKSILLLDPPAQETNDNSLPADVSTIEFLNNNYSVPSADTTYSCTIWKLPPLQGKHHLIRYEPVIQKGHEHLVHHIVVYFCSQPISDSLVGTQHNCYHNRPQEFRSCSLTFLAWAIGGTTFNYPAHVGYSLGTSDDPLYFKMETHYDNVNLRSDFVDNSGLRMYVTKQIRQYDAGMLEVGVNVDAYQIIPPYSDSFLSRGYCHENCLSEMLGDGEIHIFADLLHAHLIGKSLSTRIVRNGVELPPLLEDKNYDFDYQEQRLLKEERTIKKGDSLITDCYYDSSQRTKVTYGGLSSREEMCLSFLLYYPRKPLTACLSRLDYKIPNQFAGRKVFDIIRHLDWTKKDVRDAFAKDIEESNIYSSCHGTTHYNFNYRLTPQPNITVPYKPVDHCKA